jgi:hypothetical protein
VGGSLRIDAQPLRGMRLEAVVPWQGPA